MAALLNCDLCFRSIPNIYHSEAEHWHQEANQEDLFYEESYLLVNPIWVPEKWLLGTQSHSVLPPEHLKEFVGPRTLYGQQHKWVENNTKHGTWSTMTTWVTWIFFLFLLEFFFFFFFGIWTSVPGIKSKPVAGHTTTVAMLDPSSHYAGPGIKHRSWHCHCATVGTPHLNIYQFAPPSIAWCLVLH